MIETRATAKQSLGMPPARFLRDYWQKKPLLVRGFLEQGLDAVSPNDLAGLACEEIALSRIVKHDPKRDRWSMHNGPFSESDFAKLDKSNWTLLVQDVDKWDMDVAILLERFAFIPSWRIDDVMISYATNGGGVGPHVDQYDVFLVQGMGQRRWRISTNPHASKEFRTDSELKLLREFAPTHDWVLEPGDALYLPPGVPHDGIALGECMTYSVGMRAPSQAELLLDFAEFLAEPLGEEQRYGDCDLAPARDASEIDDAALARVKAAMPYFSNANNSTLAHWFGCFITRYRSAQIAAAPDRIVSVAELRQLLPGTSLLRNPFSRMAWRRAGRAAELFVSGESWHCPVVFARLVAGSRTIDGTALAAVCTNATAWQTLSKLVDAGHLHFARRARNTSKKT